MIDSIITGISAISGSAFRAASTAHSRQPEGEGGPSAQGTLDTDVAPHHLAEAAADRQPQPCPAVLPRGRSVGLGKGLKQLVRLFGSHANPGIAYPKLNPVFATQ